MTEGSSPDEEEGEKGADLFAHLPGYQPFQQMPMWPGQSVVPGQSQAPAPDGGAPVPPQLALPEADVRPLLLPAKPKGNARPNLSVGRPPDLQSRPDAAAAAGPWGAPGQQQKPQIQQGLQLSPQPAQPAQPGQPGQILPVPPGQPAPQANYGQPGQIDPAFIPPTPGEALPNSGFVPNPAAIIADINIGATPKSKLNSGEPLVSSASTKPNWTQPQWPGGDLRPGGIQQALARRGAGNNLPPAIAPQPLAPYSQAPPSSGNVIRNLFAPQQALNPRQNQFGLSQTGAPSNQGFRSQIPFTIKRDLAFAQQLLGDQSRQARPRNEYKQTEYIPKQPKLKVSAPDPNRPWSPVPAAQYDFFAEEERPPSAQQNTIHSLTPAKPKPQLPPEEIARGFNAAIAPTAGGIEEMEAQPDPRYSPFQGELLKDIAQQDRRFGQAEDPIPLEKKERGAAALRALGRNSDHFYDNQKPASQSDDLPSPAIKLSSHDIFGLAFYYFIVTKEVLTAPQSFFANMSLVGGLNDPLLYLVFTSIMAGIFSAVAKLNLFNFFGAAIFGFLSVALSAVLMQIIFKKLGGLGKFEQTFNVLAYSKATFIFAWIGLGPFPIGSILATLATAYFNYLGLSRVHRLPSMTTWMVIVGMTIFPLLYIIFGPK